jgi:hypothetical protein
MDTKRTTDHQYSSSSLIEATQGITNSLNFDKHNLLVLNQQKPTVIVIQTKKDPRDVLLEVAENSPMLGAAEA